MTLRLWIATLAGTLATAIPFSDAQVFRSSAAAVTIDVSVMAGRRPVSNLKAEDFQVWDNGVLQSIDEVSVDPGSIDVTAMLDTSGSVAGPLGDRLQRGVKELVAMLAPTDRAKLVTFDREFRRWDGRPLKSPEIPMIGDGGTVLFDTLCAGMVEPVQPGHRHMVVVFTDGLDTASVTPRDARMEVAARTPAVVFIVAISLQGRTSNYYFQEDLKKTREVVGDYDYLLREITDATNGEFFDLRPGGSFAEPLRQSLDRFRSRYLVKYRPTGVTGPGWHALRVGVNNKSFKVFSRRGYFGTS